MNDVLTPATCDLKDDSRRWQDIENEIPIAQWGRRVLAVFAHCAHALLKSAAGPGDYGPRVWPLAGGAFRRPAKLLPASGQI
jgi:hypothetical protein